MTATNQNLILSNPTGQGAIYLGNAASAVERGKEFDLLVLCAEEFQPKRDLVWSLPRPRILYAPNDDGETVTREQLEIALQAAREVADAFVRNEKVLVTCMAGRNRSGLVVAMSYCLLTGKPGSRAVRIVQQRRKGAAALTNPLFTDFLRKIPGKR